MLLPNLLRRYSATSTLKESYEWNRLVWSQYRYELQNCSYCVSPFSITQCSTHPQLRKLIEWINYNIVRTIDIDNLKTINVKLRIATGMLNKIDLDQISKIEIHSNLTRNIHTEYYAILESELPF